jgi:hypothetical protein
MAISTWRGPTVLGFALAMQLVARPAFAECGNGSGMTGDASLAAILKPGDAITVTPWAGAKQTGQVIAITDCSLVVRTAKQSIDMPLGSIKTVRRHQRQPVGRGAGTVLTVANECQDISCAHVALGFVGIAAVIDGFDRLVHPPKVIYRAKKRPEAGVASPRTLQPAAQPVACTS